MIFFIFWTLVIVGIAASVPVVSAIENKKRRDAMPSPEPDEFDDATPEDQEFGDAAEVVEEGAEVAGGDDFAAFDEEFK